MRQRREQRRCGSRRHRSSWGRQLCSHTRLPEPESGHATSVWPPSSPFFPLVAALSAGMRFPGRESGTNVYFGKNILKSSLSLFLILSFSCKPFIPRRRIFLNLLLMYYLKKKTTWRSALIVLRRIKQIKVLKKKKKTRESGEKDVKRLKSMIPKDTKDRNGKFVWQWSTRLVTHCYCGMWSNLFFEAGRGWPISNWT